MREAEVISKIKELKQIQPDKNWILMTKNQILGETQKAGFLTGLKNWAILVIPVLVIIFLTGIFLYNKEITSPEIAFSPEEIEAISTGLRTVESNITQATADLEKVKEPTKVLEVKESVLSTIENGGKVVKAVKKIVETPKKESPPQVLTVIRGVEDALEEMEKTYLEKEKELAKQLIEDLENRELTENQKALLEEAKKYYNEGDFGEALIKVIEVSQIR